MSKPRAMWICLSALTLLGARAFAQEPSSPDDLAKIKALSARLDALYRAKSSKGVMSMEIITPQYTRTLKMEVTTKGLKHTLIRIMEPRKERGISTLKKGDEMWNYLPKVKKEIRIPPSMMMGSWMGSDLTNDDLVRSSSWEQDYTASIEPQGTDTATLCVRYTPKPKAPVTWSKIIGCFDRKEQLPRSQDFYDEKARLVRQLRFDQVRELGGRRIPTRMTIIPYAQDKKGHQTSIQYEQMSFDVDIDEQVFSLSNLRRGR